MIKHLHAARGPNIGQLLSRLTCEVQTETLPHILAGTLKHTPGKVKARVMPRFDLTAQSKQPGRPSSRPRWPLYSEQSSTASHERSQTFRKR